MQEIPWPNAQILQIWQTGTSLAVRKAYTESWSSAQMWALWSKTHIGISDHAIVVWLLERVTLGWLGIYNGLHLFQWPMYAWFQQRKLYLRVCICWIFRWLCLSAVWRRKPNQEARANKETTRSCSVTSWKYIARRSEEEEKEKQEKEVRRWKHIGLG